VALVSDGEASAAANENFQTTPHRPVRGKFRWGREALFSCDARGRWMWRGGLLRGGEARGVGEPWASRVN